LGKALPLLLLLRLSHRFMKADQQTFSKQKPFQSRPHVMKRKLPGATGGAVPTAKEKRRELLVRAVPQFLHGGVF
jgi:hypothetical protein